MRSEVGSVCFDEKLGERDEGCDVLEALALFEGDDATEREEPAALEDFFCFLRGAGEAVEDGWRFFGVFKIGDGEEILEGFSTMEDDWEVCLGGQVKIVDEVFFLEDGVEIFVVIVKACFSDGA